MSSTTRKALRIVTSLLVWLTIFPLMLLIQELDLTRSMRGLFISVVSFAVGYLAGKIFTSNIWKD